MRLKKRLSKLDVISVAFGAIIGWGCFVLPGNTFLPSAGPLGTTIGIALGAFLVLIISQSYGYLIQKMPGSGGEFTYVKSVFGKTHGFVAAWFLIISYAMIIPLSATAIGLLLRTFFPEISNIGQLYEISGWVVNLGELVPALLSIVAVAIINVRGVKGAGWIQTMVTIVLISSIFFITALCILSPAASIENISPLFSSQDSANWPAEVLSIVSVAAWAFMGFDCIPQLSEEYTFHHKHSKNLMFISIILAALMYIAINFITTLAMPWQTLIATSDNWATGDAVKILTGNVGLVIISIAMFCAIVTGLNGFLMSSTRLVYALALENALPKPFSKIHDKFRTPTNAIYFVSAISIVFVLFGRSILSLIVDMTSVGASIVFLYTTAVAIKVALKEKKILQVAISGIGMCVSIFLLVLLVTPSMPGFVGNLAITLLFVWVLLGVIFYIANRKRYLSNK